MEKKGTLASPAMALANKVFPVPGCPHHQHAPWNAATQALEFTGVAQEFDQFLHIFLGFIHTRHIGESRGDLIFTQQPRLALAETHGAAPAAGSALHLPHEEHEYGDNDQNGETGHQQLDPQALLFGLAAFDFHPVLNQVVDQLGVFQHRAHGFKAGIVVTLAGNGEAVDNDFPDLVAADLFDERGVVHPLGGLPDVEIPEHGHQHRRYHQPQQNVFCQIVQGPNPCLSPEEVAH